MEILENLKTVLRHRLVPSFPCRKKFVVLVLKKYTKTGIKVFSVLPNFARFLDFSQNILHSIICRNKF